MNDTKNQSRKVKIHKEIGAPKIKKPPVKSNSDVKIDSVSVRCKKFDKKMEKFPQIGKLKKTPASKMKRRIIDGENDEVQSISVQKSHSGSKKLKPPVSDMLRRY